MSVDPEIQDATDNLADAQESSARTKACPQCDGKAVRAVEGLPPFPRLWRHMEKPKVTYLPCPRCKGSGVVPDLSEFAPTSPTAETEWDWVEGEP